MPRQSARLWALFLLGRIAIGNSLQAFGLKGAHFNRKKLVVDSH
jgi:hypothetical protein